MAPLVSLLTDPHRAKRAAPDQFRKPGGVERVVAVAEQDQPVRPHRILVFDVPVVFHPLVGNQQIEPVIGAGPGDRSEHREEERIDHALVGGRVLEEQ